MGETAKKTKTKITKEVHSEPKSQRDKLHLTACNYQQ